MYLPGRPFFMAFGSVPRILHAAYMFILDLQYSRVIYKY